MRAQAGITDEENDRVLKRREQELKKIVVVNYPCLTTTPATIAHWFSGIMCKKWECTLQDRYIYIKFSRFYLSNKKQRMKIDKERNEGETRGNGEERKDMNKK